MKATVKRLWAAVKAFFTRPGEFHKGYVMLSTALGEAVASGFLHGKALHDVVIIIPIVTFIGGVLWPNDTPAEYEAKRAARRRSRVKR